MEDTLGTEWPSAYHEVSGNTIKVQTCLAAAFELAASLTPGRASF